MLQRNADFNSSACKVPTHKHSPPALCFGIQPDVSTERGEDLEEQPWDLRAVSVTYSISVNYPSCCYSKSLAAKHSKTKRKLPYWSEIKSVLWKFKTGTDKPWHSHTKWSSMGITAITAGYGVMLDSLSFSWWAPAGRFSPNTELTFRYTKLSFSVTFLFSQILF